MITITKNYNSNYQISKNFKMSEFVSPDGFAIWDNEIANFVQMIQEFRIWYNRSINVSSWYRTPAYNKKIGGATNSMHLTGCAIDFPYPLEFWDFDAVRRETFQNNCARKWEDICKKWSYAGSIEIATRHLHLDIRQWGDGKFHKYYGVSK